MDTIDNLIAAHAVNRQNIAIVDGDLQLTYLECEEKSNRLAHYLREERVHLESLMAIALDRSSEVLLWMQAILKAGGAYAPLDITHPKERLLLILNSNKIPFLITETKYAALFKGYKGKVILSDQPRMRHYPLTPPLALHQSRSLAYIIHTSGSTGVPKGVMIEHKSVINYVENFMRAVANKAIKRIDFTANYAFDMAVTNTLLPLMQGLTVVVAREDIKLDPARYIDFIDENKINLIKITPSYFKVLLHAAQNHFIELLELRVIVLGGESLSTQDCAAWQTLYPHHLLLNEYGPTETTVAVSLYPFSMQDAYTNVPIGHPFNQVQFYLLNAQKKQVKQGEEGELYIGGICTARGYLNQPKATIAAFLPNPFHSSIQGTLYKTGDLCREIAPGLFDYIGRIDQQVKIRGFRVELGEIEYHLNQHPAITQAMIIAENTPTKEKQIIAYFVLKPTHQQCTIVELKAYLKKHLIPVMVPQIFIPMEVMPLNENGKLDRKALPKPRMETFENTALENPIEETLMRIWRDELQIQAIQPEDHFFELGGHSLNAARLLTQIRETFKKEIRLQDIYQSPTIHDMAKIIANSKPLIQHKKEKFQQIASLSDFQLLIWFGRIVDNKVKNINITARKQFCGKLDLNRLQQACNKLMDKHPLLSYTIYSIKPLQAYQEQKHLQIEVEEILEADTASVQAKLMASFIALREHVWEKKQPLIKVKVLIMHDQHYEIQLALPHIIADGSTSELIFKQLSALYNRSHHHQKDNYFFQYVSQEEQERQGSGRADALFWKNYLKDSALLSLPKSMIADTSGRSFRYSSYIPIPELIFQSMQEAVHQKAGSINVILGASIIQALGPFNGSNTKNKLFLNIVKTTRNNPRYDDALGCFLRIEPIKVPCNTLLSSTQLMNIIEQEIYNTEMHQATYSCVKLAAIPKKNSFWRYYLSRLFLQAYAHIFPSLQVNEEFIDACAQLSSFRKRNEFMVNMNVWGNFFKTATLQKSLFNIEAKPLPIIQEDLLSIDYVLDVCFLKDDYLKPYVVISGNLHPAIREQIANRIIHALASLSVEVKEEM